MSELRSVIDELRAEVLAEQPDAVIEEDFAELQRAVELLDVERLRRLAEIDRRRLFERDGHLSAASWLAARFKVAWGAAREQIRIARGLDEMPVARRALDDGGLSTSGLRVLASAREADPEAFRASEQLLVDAGRVHSVRDLARVAAYWRQAVERDHAIEGEERLRADRRLHASTTLLGTVRVDGTLDPETGETLLTALGAVLDAEARSAAEDDRTPAQRRADALGEICRQWLDRPNRPEVAGERPHVIVTVAADALRRAVGASSADEWSAGETPSTDEALSAKGRPFGDEAAVSARQIRVGARGTHAAGPRVCELDHVGPVGVETARRIACDASVMRVMLAGRSEPLDVGRRTPIVSPAMRRAVIVRDRHCRFPGCDRPHTWCDAHHVRHWADGGSTAVTNLLLLCRRHHRSVHERGGFRLELVEGRPVFRRADGSTLEDRAPP